MADLISLYKFTVLYLLNLLCKRFSGDGSLQPQVEVSICSEGNWKNENVAKCDEAGNPTGYDQNVLSTFPRLQPSIPIAEESGTKQWLCLAVCPVCD